MEIFGIITAAVITLFLCIFLLRSQFSIAKIVKRSTIVCFCGCLVLLVAVRLLTSAVWIIATFTMVIAGFLSWYIGQAKPVKALSFGVLFGVLQLVSGIVCILIQRVVPDLGLPHTLIPEIVVLYALIAFTCIFSEKWHLAQNGLLALIPIWLVLLLLCEELLRRRNDMGISILLFFADLWMLYAGVHLMFVCKKIEARLLVALEAQQKSHHYILQEEYYQKLQNKQDETRALWHDLNKYLRAAKAENPDASSLNQLENMLQSATQIVDVGNRVLNVILNEYDQAARAAGTNLQLKVLVTQELPVSPADLYILIGNTMDNALEACNELPQTQRTINLTLRTYNGVLYYHLTNPYINLDKKIRKDQAHGYGLTNVRNCVHKYAGDIQIDDQNGIFSFSAHLNLEEIL